MIKESADNLWLDGVHYMYYQADAFPGFVTKDGLVICRSPKGTHGDLQRYIKQYVNYYPKKSKSEYFTIYKEPDMDKFIYYNQEDWKNRIELVTHFRIWTNSRICAFWDFFEEIPRDRVDILLDYIEETFGNSKEWRFATGDTTKEADYVLSYDEFLDKIQLPDNVDDDAKKKNEELRNLHMIDPSIKGQLLKKFGVVSKNPIPLSIKQSLMTSEAVITENPDRIKVSKGDDWYPELGPIYNNFNVGNNYTFSIDRNGAGMYASTVSYKGGLEDSATHEVLCSHLYDILYNDAGSSDYSVDLKYIGNMDDYTKGLEDITVFDRMREVYDDCVYGRYFKDYKIVSFWNFLHQINSNQKRAVMSIISNIGDNPKKLLYQPLDVSTNLDKYKQSSFGNYSTGELREVIEDNNPQFLTYDEFMEKTGDSSTDTSIQDNIKDIHTLDPSIKGAVLKQKGVGLKNPIPLDVKQKAMTSESHDVILESITNKYYAFDWDDNLMYMPTKIYTEDDKGKVIPISTEDFALCRSKIGKEPFEWEGHTIVGYTTKFNPFKDFRSDGDDKFLTDSFDAKTGPAWPDFVEAVNNGEIFSIITARGHNPNTLKTAVSNLIKANKNGLSYDKCVKSLIKYVKASKHKHITFTKEKLFNWYIEKLCKWYPVTFGEGHAGNPELLKIVAMRKFRNHIKRKFSGLNLEFRNKVSNKFKLGFSDDDLGNVRTMYKHFPKDKMFHTHGNKKKVFKEALVPFDKNITRKIRKGISKGWKLGRNKKFEPGQFGFDIEYNVVYNREYDYYQYNTDNNYGDDGPDYEMIIDDLINEIEPMIKGHGYAVSSYGSGEYNKWQLGEDDEQFEIASPILTTKDIPKVKTILNKITDHFLRKDGDKSLGGHSSAHVHIGVKDLNAFNIISLFSMIDEDKLYGLSDNRTKGYARSKKEFIGALFNKFRILYGIKLDDGRDIKIKETALANILTEIRQRFYGINYWTHIETVEFRYLSNEVMLDVDKFIEAINYYQLLVKLSKNRNVVKLPIGDQTMTLTRLVNDKDGFDYSLKLEN